MADAVTEVVGAVEPVEEQPAAPALVDPGQRLPWDALPNLARTLANTELVPKALRGRPAAVLGVMLYADEVRVGRMMALQHVSFIDGTPTASATLMRALILRAGHILEWREASDTVAALYGRRRDNGRQMIARFTIDQARRAGLLNKANWQHYPDAMLAARATAKLGRLHFADVLLGLQYTPEELGVVAGPYDAIDVDYDAAADADVPVVDYETGEILDDDVEVTDDTPAHEIQATMLDAADAADAEWLRQARDEQDEVDGQVAMWDAGDES